MQSFQKAARHRCKIKMALQGPSGSGKTYSSLLLAYGLTNDWSKIAVIDTENGSANLYAHLGDYSVMTLTAPYSPERYKEAVEQAVNAGFECLVIDSLSHEWNGSGGVLDIHSNIPGNSFTAWAKVTPRHNACMQAILNSDIHVVATMRSKTDYVMSERNGKQVPEKVGLKATQREDAEYEFTLVFELNPHHIAFVSKDRTGLFKTMYEQRITAETGQTIRNWCNQGDEVTAEAPAAEQDFKEVIDQCQTLAELVELYNCNEDKQVLYRDHFVRRKTELNNQLKHLLNGQHI